MSRISFIRDLGELIVFSTGLWGMVALLSIMLPIANLMVGTIPLASGISELATVLAVIATFFAFVYAYTEKVHLLEFEMRRPFYRGETVNPRRDMLHGSATRFVWGLVSLSVYIILNAAYGILLGTSSSEAAKWLIPVVEPISAVLYAASFALVTGAFGALAVMQHARVRTVEAEMSSGRGSVNLGIRDETRNLSGGTLPTSPDGIGDSQRKD